MVVAEVWGGRDRHLRSGGLVSSPPKPMRLFWAAEMHAVLLGACGEDEPFELLGCVEGVGRNWANIDVPIFLIRVVFCK